MAGSPDGAGSRDSAKGDRIMWRGRNHQHVVDAPLVCGYLGANRRRRKRTAMAGTLRAGAGGAGRARSVLLEHLDFQRRALPGNCPTLRRSGMVVKTAVRPMACAEHHVVAATSHYGCRRQRSAGRQSADKRGEPTVAGFRRQIKHIAKAACGSSDAIAKSALELRIQDWPGAGKKNPPESEVGTMWFGTKSWGAATHSSKKGAHVVQFQWFRLPRGRSTEAGRSCPPHAGAGN